jgi:VWFA-related protein
MNLKPEIILQRIKQNLSLLFWINLALIVSHITGFAQDPKEEKTQIKNFGSSLKQNRKQSDKKKPEKTQDESADDDTVRIGTNLILNDVLVLDKQSNAVTGLKKEDFIVKEDDQAQEIDFFSPGDNSAIPRSIVLMIDFYGFPLGYLDASIDSAKALIDKLNPKDEMAIVTSEIKLLQPFTRDKALLKKKIDTLKRDFIKRDLARIADFGFQYESLLATLNEMFTGSEKRPIIIMQTQGDTLFLLKPTAANARPPLTDLSIKTYPALKSADKITPYRSLSYEEVYFAAEKSRAVIYTITPGLSLIGYSQQEQIERTLIMYEKQWTEAHELMRDATFDLKKNLKSLREEILDMKIYHSQMVLKKQASLAALSKVSGGWIDFLETPEQATAIYSRILADINQRYVIGYYSTNETKDGKRRTIKIEIKNHPEYTVLGHKTYFAPTSP